MTVKQAILSFSQSEKIKSGLIWLSQAIEIQNSLSEAERRGAEKSVRTLLSMVGREIHVARKVAEDASWEDAEKHVDLAMVMMNSGVPHEAVYHMTRALSRVTDIGQRSLACLKHHGLI
jgi:hypothetical protein